MKTYKCDSKAKFKYVFDIIIMVCFIHHVSVLNQNHGVLEVVLLLSLGGWMKVQGGEWLDQGAWQSGILPPYLKTEVEPTSETLWY
jgi:hypothetical protein